MRKLTTEEEALLSCILMLVNGTILGYLLRG